MLNFGFPAKAYTVGSIAILLGTILLSWALFVHQGGDPFLPTISSTWTAPPASYISRWAVGNMCCALFAVNAFIYWADSAAFAGPRRLLVSPAVILQMAFAALFCFSWVGAICNSTVDTCMGNDALHTAFALAFFFLYDLMMILSATSKLHAAVRDGTPVRGAVRSLLLAVASSVLTAARACLPGPLAAAEDVDTVIAVVEWINVAIVGLWTLSNALGSEGINEMGFGLVTKGDAGKEGADGLAVVVFRGASALELSNVVGGLFIFVLASTCILGLAVGYIPRVEGAFWYISDMWTQPPGNWISRWGVVQATHWAYAVQLSLYFTAKEKTTELKALTLVAMIALFSLSVVGCVNEDEDFDVHTTAASIFFAGYDIYMLGTIYLNQTADPSRERMRRLRRDAGLSAVLCQGLRLALPLLLPLGSPRGSLVRTLSAALEWTNAFLIITFFVADVRSREQSSVCMNGVFSTDLQAVAAQKGLRQKLLRTASGVVAAAL